ncbi:hypothetical protein R1flu_021543 [Riccia fluitans]|uniref:Uncharacterized protein n=1 Tax=Riccia fluitans TaxID=41844 RepID=A0ABD1ZPN2_9MARC
MAVPYCDGVLLNIVIISSCFTMSSPVFCICILLAKILGVLSDRFVRQHFHVGETLSQKHLSYNVLRGTAAPAAAATTAACPAMISAGVGGVGLGVVGGCYSDSILACCFAGELKTEFGFGKGLEIEILVL